MNMDGEKCAMYKMLDAHFGVSCATRSVPFVVARLDYGTNTGDGLIVPVALIRNKMSVRRSTI